MIFNLEKMQQVLDRFPLPPTAGELEAAKRLGFPGLPGIKMGSKAHERLLAVQNHDEVKRIFPTGIPFVVDATIPEDELQLITVGILREGIKRMRL